MECCLPLMFFFILFSLGFGSFMQDEPGTEEYKSDKALMELSLFFFIVFVLFFGFSMGAPNRDMM